MEKKKKKKKEATAGDQWGALSWLSQATRGKMQRPAGPCGTHQRDDGALGGELRGAEQRPDEAVDLLLLGVVLVVIGGDLRLLQQREAKSVTSQSTQTVAGQIFGNKIGPRRDSTYN